jgi:hypothetical protein
VVSDQRRTTYSDPSPPFYLPLPSPEALPRNKYFVGRMNPTLSRNKARMQMPDLAYR